MTLDTPHAVTMDITIYYSAGKVFPFLGPTS